MGRRVWMCLSMVVYFVFDIFGFGKQICCILQRGGYHQHAEANAIKGGRMIAAHSIAFINPQ